MDNGNDVFNQVLNVIDTVGSLAILGWFVWAFVNGKIMSEAVAMKYMESMKLGVRNLSDEIKKQIDLSVRNAVTIAMYETKKGNGEPHVTLAEVNAAVKKQLLELQSQTDQTRPE